MDEGLPAITPADLIDHLFGLTKILHAAQSDDVVHFNTPEVKRACSEFISDPVASTLFVTKHTNGWVVSLQLDDVPDVTPVATMVVIKEKGPIVGDIDKKLQVVHIPHHGGSFDTLRLLVSLGVGTYFDAITSQNRTDVVTSTKKKINELALSLQHLEQMIQVPDLIGTSHPIIREAVSNGATLDNYTEIIHESTLNDTSFLNSVQTIVNEWVRSIQSLTRMDRDVSEGSALDEANFWISMESSLTAIQEQLDSSDVQLSLEVLKYAKRYHATVSFMSDIGIKDAMARAVDYNKLMKDIPLNELVAAESFSKIEEAIVLIMNHLKKLRITSYPVNKALRFVEAISSDLDNKLKPMVQDLMALEFEAFTKQVQDLEFVFDTWDRQVKEFVNLSRELLRKRGEKFIFVKINPKTDYIKERLADALDFRTRHENFVATVRNIEMPQDDVEHAYAALRDVDFLEQGKNWNAAKRTYDNRIQQIENHIVAQLRTKLEATSNFNEMFQVFGSHKSLLERPRIRGAIQEYQSQLLAVVKDEIAHLQHNFTNKKEFDSFAPLKDYPEIAFSLIWARQTEVKLIYLLERIELVLGKEWSSYAEGQKIYSESMTFKNKLNVQGLYSEWLDSVAGKTVSGKIFHLVKENNTTTLTINFDDSLMSLFKEVRALCWQKFAVPHGVIVSSRQVRKVYPHAIILKESLRTLESTLQKVESLGQSEVLLLAEKKQIYELIATCMSIDWESLSRSQDLEVAEISSTEHNQLSQIMDLERSIEKLFHKAEALQSYQDDISTALENIKTIEFSSDGLGTCTRDLQTVTDKISSAGFSGLDAFVDGLNNSLIEALIARFTKTSITGITMEHQIQVGSALAVHPLLETSKARLYQYAHDIVETLLSQKKIIVRTLHSPSEAERLSFTPHMDKITRHLEEMLTLLEQDFSNATSFVDTWYQFQALWDVNSDTMYADLTLTGWFTLFEEIQKSRALFDNAEVTRTFGPLVINFDDARVQIISRFNLWNRDVLARFAGFLSVTTRSTHNRIVNARKSLEKNDLNISSVQDTVEMIMNVQKQKRCAEELRTLIQDLRTAEKLLYKLRFKLSADHVFADQLENDFEALLEIVFRRSNSIDEHIDVIRKTLESECARVQNAISEAHQNWLSSRPTDNSLSPKDAIASLDDMERYLESIQSRRTLLLDATALLAIPVGVNGDLNSTLQELKDLKSVWLSIQGLWGSLEDLRNMKWSSLKPRSLRSQLEELVSNTKAMPVRVRQHQPFQHFLKTVTELSATQKTLVSLKEDYVKERHMKALFKAVGRDYTTDLTVGHVWDLNLLLNQGIIKSIIEQANSERAIEEALQGIRDAWDDQRFVFFEYKLQRLVKNFPQLLELASNDIASLSSMRNSPVFKVFEKDITHWETTLNSLYQIVDIWVEVQRKWIDLDGVFDASSGVRKLLPMEYSRFHSVSSEYLAILAKLHRHNLAIEISSIPDLFQTFERICESMNRISKALGEFLEKQRELCARLYFVGNDDLIDMIANKDNVGKHFKKMFAGVSSVGYGNSGSKITSVQSSDGEVMTLRSPVCLEKYQRLDEWLNQLDYEIKITLSQLLTESIPAFESLSVSEWVTIYPSQILLLSLQVMWTKSVESAVTDGTLSTVLADLDSLLLKLGDLPESLSKKKEALIIESVHHKDVVSEMLKSRVCTCTHFTWLKNQRFYINREESDPLKSLIVKHSTKSFYYGYEFLGSMDRLVYTPLLNSCFLAMTGALDQGLGGSPFGPAGTGKTETIKALGQNLGKMVLVFNCDESFDFQAITRLLVGICQIGGWGCFDEFNRLDKNILSAVSSQLELIELALKHEGRTVKLLDHATPMGDGTGVFVTMNPEYAGRTTLPDNLKKLFRSFSMQKPDTLVIAEVLLRARGFDDARNSAVSVVKFFQSLSESCSSQIHYDFGLRALKSALEHAAKVRTRTATKSIQAIVKALDEMVLPRLVSSDIELYNGLMQDIFPGILAVDEDSDLRDALKSYAMQDGLVASEGWLTKAVQLFRVQETKQGVMIVGKSGSGKSLLWKTLLSAITKTTGTEFVSFIIDPKVMTKSQLFGYLDPITREWVDGLFTLIIRRLNEDLRGESGKATWIVFDGDIDPVWVESLNSVLDDNKILTLPNGERLRIPNSVRLVFEVDGLAHATPATVSRCGMIWLEEGVVSLADVYAHQIHLFETLPSSNEEYTSGSRLECAKIVFEALPSQLLASLITTSAQILHPVMSVSALSTLRNLFVLLRSLLDRHDLDTPMSREFVIRCLMLALVWSFAGACTTEEKRSFTKSLSKIAAFQNLLPDDESDNLLDYDVDEKRGWINISELVPPTVLETHAIANPNTVVQTIDTVKHEQLVYSVLREKQSMLLCGPPGSGKTMTLYAALERSPDVDLINMNFSKETEPRAVLRALEQLCEYKRTADGFVLRPKLAGKRVVLFADEINLPREDEYGTQHVISFLRQLIEKKGFWRTSDRQWVHIKDIQLVGACNPPTDSGRIVLSDRFLSHVLVVMVDYPGRLALEQIYQAFTASVLKVVPQLSGYTKELTGAILEVYSESVAHFSSGVQQHYIYSPRELTRWVRGIYSALRPLDQMGLSGLIRLWAHEALRLFSDRLVNEDERLWTWNLIMLTAKKFFPTHDLEDALVRPVLYSDWLSLGYDPVQLEDIVPFIKERLRVFADEVLDVELALYDEAVDHILRIDRVLKQAQGHMILVGPSSSGKTTLTKFVSWINGLKIHQLGVNRRYTLNEFDATLKDLLKRSGVGDERICFIVDESTILDGAFLERMNSLLANSQIQEIFDQEELVMLLNSCKEQVIARGLLLDTQEELYDWFTQQVAKNLHVVFTISDPTALNAPQIIASPALFNRCVLNWMGDWSDKSLSQVTTEMLQMVPLDRQDYEKPEGYASDNGVDILMYRDAIVDSLISIHKSFKKFSSPGKLIECIKNFTSVYYAKDAELKEHQKHVDSGLIRLKETVLKVKRLKDDLAEKKTVLEQKEIDAKRTLNKILTEQNEAERKQEASIEIQAALERQDVILEKRRAVVMEDLALAEPAVLEARRGVQNIKKQHLTELRSMGNPPAAVQLTLESVCVLLGYEVGSWRDVQSIIRKDDFIANIVNFDCEEQVTPEVREFMESTYLSRTDYNFQAADRASKACGPLLQWVEAQVKYALVLDKIGPLRDEVEALEEESDRTQARLAAADDMIKELQESIESFKDEYSELIRDIENIKSQMSTVEGKAGRAMKLVDSLTEERARWTKSVQKFADEYKCLAGNSLLAAAQLTWAGGFDSKGRQKFLSTCLQQLSRANIKFDNQFRFVNFLNSPANLLAWEGHGLSNDELFFENVTIIENCDRIPLIIDPFGSILDVITSKISPQKISITSFLDDGFVRTLENSLRFGGLLVIQDSEYFDPIVSPVLNGDFQKVGGRTLVKIGGRDIDCSKNFKLYLHSRDANIRPSPFVLTRTVTVDFTVTNSSLEVQALNMALSSERPDLENQRLELIKLDTEFKVKLRGLEDSLLTALSESRGDLLENSELLATLEDLKKESTLVEEKIVETANVMANIDGVIVQYEPFSRAVALIFAVVERLNILSDFYHFSLSSYLEYVTRVLLFPSQQISTQSERVQQLVLSLYQEVFAEISLSLTTRDKMVFALCLALIYMKEKDGELLSRFVLALLAGGGDEDSCRVVKDAFAIMLVEIPDTTASKLLTGVDVLSTVKSTGLEIDELSDFLDSYFLHKGIGESLVVLSQFLSTGSGHFSSKYDMAHVLSESNHRPIILGAVAGCDASSKVRNLAQMEQKPIRVIALGSPEAVEIATRELDRCAKSGEWLLVQNVQTAPGWLEYLEKKLQGLLPHSGFKFFLTCDIKASLPRTLLRYSRLLVTENSPGVKNIMMECLKAVFTRPKDIVPVEKSQILFMLCWFHAIVQERSRYVPMGFTKNYEFNDSDFEGATFLIDRWFDVIHAGRTNVSPELIDWSALQFLVGDIVYGGKVDVQSDLIVLRVLAGKLFTVDIFNDGFNLIQDVTNAGPDETLALPEVIEIGQLNKWTLGLPDLQPPSWVGLDMDAEVKLVENKNKEIVDYSRRLFEEVALVGDGS